MKYSNCLKTICGLSVFVASAITRAGGQTDAQKAANAANLRAIGTAITAYQGPTQAELGTAQAASAAIATTAPATRPTSAPSADYSVIDWSVFIAEPTGDHANSADSIKSTFPAFVITRRSEVEPEKSENRAADTSNRLGENKSSDPMPIGVIRVVGGAVPSAKFDVLLSISSGEFESQWPRAESRPNRLLWSNLIASDDAPTMEQLGDNDWMKPLRDADSHYLTSGGERGSGESRGERFLMYDASPVLPVAIKVEASGENAYKITNIGSPDLTDFEIYKGKADGWRSARVDSLVGTHVPVAKATGGNELKIAAGDTLSITLSGTNGEEDSARTMHVGPSGTVSVPGIGSVNVAGKTTDEAQDAIVEVYKNRNMPIGDVKVEIAPKGGADAKPTTEPAGPATVMTLSGNALSDPKQLLAGWKDRLAAAAIQPADIDVILNILGKYAIDPGRLTAVYELNSSQMDDLLPMEIVPTPAKVTRVGIVVLRNIDPAINDEIDQLVKQLGDDDWSKREAAQKKLVAFGRAAKGAVEKSSHSKDMEVVWRSEAILHAIDPKAPAQQ